MVSREDGDATAARTAASAATVEVVRVGVHELRRPDEGLEVRPIDLHELGGPLGLVSSAAPRGSSGRAGTAGLEPAVEGTGALRLVRIDHLLPAEPADEEVSRPVTPASRDAAVSPAARPVAPPLPLRVPSVVPGVPAEGHAGEEPGPATEPTGPAIDLLERPPRHRRRRPHRFAPGLRRRLWVVALLVLAGISGGFAMTKGGKPGYSAQDLLEVRAGSIPANPGGAVGAGYLAITYAALVPSDTAVVDAIATRAGMSPADVAGGLSAAAEAGTGLFTVTFSAPTAAQAIAGANEAGAVLSSAAPPGPAFVSRSIAVVRSAAFAKPGKNKRLYGLVGGAVGGGLLGLILLLVLERVDARVDDPEDASATCDVPATRWPGGMSVRELAVALARRSPDAPLSLVPLTAAVRPATERLARLLGGAWAETGASTPPPVVTPYDEAPAALSEGSGPTVVVVAEGGPVRSLSETAARLRLLERPPTFIVVCDRA